MKLYRSLPGTSRYLQAVLLTLLTISHSSYAQQTAAAQKPIQVDPGPFADNAHHWYDIADRSNVINARPGRPKHAPTELREIGDNILLLQKDNGGWPKNYDIMAVLTPGQKDSLNKPQVKSKLNTTFDNGSTFSHVGALAVIYSGLKDEKYKIAAQKGLDYILTAQYKNGGWPQYFPLENNYSRNITYNDGNFVGIMELLKDIVENKPQFAFLDKDVRSRVKAAYDLAIPCIINTQINDAGRPTAWCQQYDEVTLQPSWARKFEPASICNQESAGVVMFLMSIDRPSKEIIKSVNDAVAWFNESKIYNIRVKTVAAPRMPTQYRVSETDRVVVIDSTAPPIWARFYELKTHKPIFCNRDSKIVYSLAEVDRERRDGYSWYGYGPQKVLDRYPVWKKQWAVN